MSDTLIRPDDGNWRMLSKREKEYLEQLERELGNAIRVSDASSSALNAIITDRDKQLASANKLIEEIIERAGKQITCPFKNNAPSLRCKNYNSALVTDCIKCCKHWLKTGKTAWKEN